MTCAFHDRGVVEQHFYGELEPGERARFEAHVEACETCRAALVDLQTVAGALDAQPRIEAPPDGDWTSFMDRLEARTAIAGRGGSWRAALWPALKIAALLALVTIAVLAGRRWERASHPAEPVRTAGTASPAAAFEALAEQHLERSKLVLFGLATKDPRRARPADWRYERSLASAMLPDTTQYRLAARQQGLDGLAGVLGDLEVVLLQTSLSDDADPGALARLQSLIDKRDLLVKIEIVGTIERNDTARPATTARPSGNGA